MSATSLYRLSGLAFLVALPLQVIGLLIHPPGEEIRHVLESTYSLAHIIVVGAWLLILLGLPGLYVYQASRAGKLGLICFAFLMIAAAYHFYLVLYEAFVTPILAKDVATQRLVGPGGDLAHGAEVVAMLFMPSIIAIPLFGVASLRAGVFPRLSAWLQIVSVPIWLACALLFSLLPGRIEDALLAPVNFGPITVFYTILTLGYAHGGYVLWNAVGAERDVPVRLTTSQGVS